MIKLGITGGIGSGKSVICKILESFGVPVFRADEEGRKLLACDSSVQNRVIRLLGKEILTGDKPDTRKIAAIVFSNPDKLAALNGIIHPAVRESFIKWSEQFAHSPCVAEEAAILFESGGAKLLDYTILVTAPEEVRITRTMQRDNISEEEVKRRMKYQWSDEEKKKHADFVITNDENNALIPQVIAILGKLKINIGKTNS